jgi:acetyl esterase/lipase
MQPSSRLLLAGAAAAASTANATKPIAVQGPLSVPAFAFGVVPSELPLQTGIFQMATGVLAARGGGTRGWRGKLGLAAYAASAAGLVAIHRTATKAGGVLETALVDELGANYRTRIREPFSPQPETAVTRRQLLLPDMRARKRYRVGRDISYGDAGVRNHLDVWKRADLPNDAKAPVLFQVHGGAWMVGMKEGQAETLMAHLAERGWVCVTANYRLSPRATWPDHIVDVKRALAWIKEHIAEYGGDPDFVAITGGSAGGHLCALAALTPDDPQYQPGFEDADTSVAAAVPIYGRYDWFTTKGAGRWEFVLILLQRLVVKKRLTKHLQIYRDASPITRVRADAPPFFVLHGVDDSLIPVPEARAFVAAMRDVSKEAVVYSEIPHAQHAFDFFGSPRGYYTAHAVEKFLSWVHARRDEK